MNSQITPEEKLLTLIKQAQSKFKIKKDLKLFTHINVVLIFIIAAISVVFVVDLFTPDTKNVAELNVDLERQAVKVTPVAEEEPDYELPEVEDKEAITPAVRLEDLVKDYVVLGIVTGEQNQAIIEDRAKKTTVFIYKGDKLGELDVVEIKANKVVLDYKGEKIDLKM